MFYQEYVHLQLGFQSSVEHTVAALVGMIPEGLYLLTSVAVAASRHEAPTKRRVLVQDMNCIETLARVDVLCVDKTGTITEPKMEVENVIPLTAEPPEELEAALTASVWRHRAGKRHGPGHCGVVSRETTGSAPSASLYLGGQVVRRGV